MEDHTPSTVASRFFITGCRQARRNDSFGEPFPEFTNSHIASQGSSNHTSMSYHDSVPPSSYDNGHHSLILLEQNRCPDSVCLPNDHSHDYDGIMRVPLLDETALFVANYLHQLRLKYGMDITLEQVIRICGGQCDTPDPKPTYGQIGMDDHFVSNHSSPSAGDTGGQSSRSTRQSTPSERGHFRSSAVAQTDHEVFRDGDRWKVRCHEGSCSGNVLMKDNFSRHVRERHLGGKRKTGESSLLWHAHPGTK